MQVPCNPNHSKSTALLQTCGPVQLRTRTNFGCSLGPSARHFSTSCTSIEGKEGKSTSRPLKYDQD